MSGQTGIECARVLAVFHNEIFARRARFHAVNHGLRVGCRHFGNHGVVVECHGIGPSPHALLPSVDACRARAIVAAPRAGAHQVPQPGARILAARLRIVGVVTVGRAEVVAELMANYAYRGHASPGEKLRLNGVSAHVNAAEFLSVDYAAVRPDVGFVARSLLSGALMYHRYAVDNAVAVVVELLQVERVAHKTERIAYHFGRAIGSVGRFRLG